MFGLYFQLIGILVGKDLCCMRFGRFKVGGGVASEIAAQHRESYGITECNK